MAVRLPPAPLSHIVVLPNFTRARIETVTPRDVRLYDANGSLIGLMQQIANTAVERKFQEVATVRQWGS